MGTLCTLCTLGSPERSAIDFPTFERASARSRSTIQVRSPSADLARVARCPAAPSNAHAARAELCACTFCVAGPWPHLETCVPSLALRHGTACAAVLFRQRTSSARVLHEKRTSARTRIAVGSSRAHGMRSFQLFECACCTKALIFVLVRAELMCIAGPCSHPRLTSSLRMCGPTTSRRPVSLPTTSSSDTTCSVSWTPHRVLWLRCAFGSPERSAIDFPTFERASARSRSTIQVRSPSADLARVARCPAAPSNAHAARAELCA
jgi:hypothetical protein